MYFLIILKAVFTFFLVESAVSELIRSKFIVSLCLTNDSFILLA